MDVMKDMRLFAFALDTSICDTPVTLYFDCSRSENVDLELSLTNEMLRNGVLFKVLIS